MTRTNIQAVIAYEGIATDDARVLDVDGLSWDLPVALVSIDRDVVGSLTAIERQYLDEDRGTARIVATGFLEDESSLRAHAATEVELGPLHMHGFRLLDGRILVVMLRDVSAWGDLGTPVVVADGP